MDDETPPRLLLALIAPANAWPQKDRLQNSYYSDRLGTAIVVDVSSIEELMGRVRDPRGWTGIVGRSGAGDGKASLTGDVTPDRAD